MGRVKMYHACSEVGHLLENRSSIPRLCEQFLPDCNLAWLFIEREIGFSYHINQKNRNLENQANETKNSQGNPRRILPGTCGKQAGG